MDSVVDSSGLKLIDICKNSELKLLNGRVGQDKDIGFYTYKHTAQYVDTQWVHNCFIRLMQQYPLQIKKTS